MEAEKPYVIVRTDSAGVNERTLAEIKAIEAVIRDPDCDEDYRASLYTRLARLKREAGIEGD